MNIEQEADNRIKRKPEVRALIAKGSKLHKSKRKDGWIYEIGESGRVYRYFVRADRNGVHVRRVTTLFDDEDYDI